MHTPTSLTISIWHCLSLPPSALSSLSLPGAISGPAIPSSFKIGLLAQSSIAVSALSAALIHSVRNSIPVPNVTVPQDHAVVEFNSEKLYTIDGARPASPWGPFPGLWKTKDGYVRIHDAFPHHRDGSLRLLGLGQDASREDIAQKVGGWKSVDLENAGAENGLAIYALRSYEEWDASPQSSPVDAFPMSIVRTGDAAPGLPKTLTPGNDKCLRGLRVVEMTRVIAGPVAGKTLAAHGADVIWVTSPNLPDIPAVDRDMGRGKRTVHLEIHDEADRRKLFELIKTCDVFIQGYRPGSLVKHGLAPEQLAELNPGIICANVSAFGPVGPWKERRGFDSLVQTCSGMNISEAKHSGGGEVGRQMPCQALDHGTGYFLTAGILAALYRRAGEGGSYCVDVSLAGTMKYLRSLGQYEGKTGFQSAPLGGLEDLKDYIETKASGFGVMRAVRHSAVVDGCGVGWDEMPKPLGSDEARWLN